MICKILYINKYKINLRCYNNIERNIIKIIKYRIKRIDLVFLYGLNSKHMLMDNYHLQLYKN